MIIISILQKDEPQIHHVHKILLSQLSTILSRFLKPDAIHEATYHLTKIDLSNPLNHKPNDEIQIGFQCKEYIEKNKSCLDLKVFYQNATNFYIQAANYMIQKYPFNDPVLLHAEVLDIERRTQAKSNSVEFFAMKFGLVSVQDMDKLEQEFSLYQIDQDVDDIIASSTTDRIDEKWHKIGGIKDITRHTMKYPLLCKTLKAVLLIFHGNSDCERVFSVVEKNKTKQRASLSTRTLSSLMVHRLAMESRQKVYATPVPTREVVNGAKRATYEGLQRKEKA
ncbi:uncharacterized protein [Diadema antillarum]|uniref:uncharacterized protein n=1 Tax=Diadema antillarum TaxID=105358 RepID=UPI003A892C41